MIYQDFYSLRNINFVYLNGFDKDKKGIKMKIKKIFVVIISIVVLLFAENNNSKKIYNMTNFEIDSLLKTESQNNLTITDRINLYSELFLGMPYSWTATGDGPYALLESYPLVDFDSTNCMVYCEHVLSMSISDSWDNFFNNLQKNKI